MAAISRPVAYGALAALVAIVVIWTGPSSDTGAANVSHRHLSAKRAGPDWDLPAPDPNLHFAHIRTVSRNVFVPLVTDEKPLPPPRVPAATEDQVQIPAKLAGGEGSWAYTGMVVANGVRMALLENKANKQSGYVREGDFWKAAHIVGITSACIVLADEKGTTQTVFRFDPNAPPKAKPEPSSGFGPGGVSSPLPGPIGPGMTRSGPSGPIRPPSALPSATFSVPARPSR